MNNAAQKAIDTLLGIAEDENAADEARIHAACSILDRLDKVPATDLATA